MIMNYRSAANNSSINDFMGYVYFLLNSEDGNIYVLSLITDEATNTQSVEFVLKNGEVDAETAIICWSDTLTTLVDMIEGYNGVNIPANFYSKLDELLPIKVMVHRDRVAGKSTLTFL